MQGSTGDRYASLLGQFNWYSLCAESQPSGLRLQIGVVSQDPHLLSMSIADNIAYGLEDVSRLASLILSHIAQQQQWQSCIKSHLPDGFRA